MMIHMKCQDLFLKRKIRMFFNENLLGALKVNCPREIGLDYKEMYGQMR